MRASDFDYALPPERIAQRPAEERDRARLYLLPRAGGEARHAVVADLPELLPPRALLVVNDSRVFPARLRGRKATGGRVELLLLAAVEIAATAGRWTERWRALGGSSKGLKAGQAIALDGERPPAAEIVSTDGAEVEVAFSGDEPGGMLAACARLGEVPLPPYIGRDGAPDDADRDRYQTVYARVPGAAAAPTAGLHFTPGLLEALSARGVERAAVTLHVGLGTFAPLRDDDVTDLRELHGERYEIPEATASAIARARREGRAVVAVGTTTVRTLETAAAEGGTVAPSSGETRLFIKPGHRFRAIDGMLTNFHLPRSTLLMLVSAFAGTERVLSAYRDAVARGYRFYSFGDAMLIL